MDRAAISGGAVLVDDRGRVAALGPDPSVPAPPDAELVDLGAALLLPGLINTHTHLELTGFAAGDPDPEFAAWIRNLRTLKERRTADEYAAAARRGIEECWAAGVTTIAETGDSGAVLAALAAMGGSGIVYQEVFGPHPDQLEHSLGGLAERVTVLRARASGRVRLGVSPHAPYTVSGPLYRAVARWARAEALPLALHLAESKAETELVTQGRGAFASAWQARGIPLQSVARSPVAYLDGLGVLGPDTLCIHTVQVDPEDIGLLASRGVAIAHCPLSNARHAHGTAPLEALLGAGLRVGVGTDSVASVGRLDLLAEVRAARSLAGLGAEAALRLVTIDAARALGLQDEIGSITTGKWADLTAVPAPDRAADPYEAALVARPGDTRVTCLSGRLVHRRAREALPTA